MRHPGELAVRRRAGIDADEWGTGSVGKVIPAVAAEFLRTQRMVVIAGRSEEHLWSTALTGPPGFVSVEGEDALTIHSEPPPQDPLHDAFGPSSEIGMLAIEPESRRRMRINGHAQAVGAGLRVRTDQVYANCPKYIQTRRVVCEHAPAALRFSQSDRLSDAQRSWIAQADTFFIATGAEGHGLDLSHRGGNPGFIDVRADGLRWPDYVGNSMYMTLGNLHLDPRAGLLFIGWETGRTLHLTGRAHIDWNPDHAAQHAGALRLVDFTIDRVLEISNRLPLRWQLDKLSKFNPPVKGL